MRDDTVEAVATALRTADHAVALTGAGVSTASGIPDFRSEGGVWDTFDPAEFQSITSGLSESVCLGKVWNLPRQTTR
nr:Sir2 family NAD-dependent protein deacetylase [Halovenus aranensis]